MIIILMGVSGSGKTTVGRLLAQCLTWHFYDGDSFHPAANIAKMSAGQPLTDADRAAWLETLSGLIQEKIHAGQDVVIACSALKHAYRERLSQPDRRRIRFFHLKGSYELILERMQQRDERSDHFMRPDMLRSQFDTLEEPLDIPFVDISLPPPQIVEKIVEQLMTTKYSLGILGLGVMGRSLALNFLRNGFAPIGFDLAPRLPEDFPVRGTTSLEELVAALTPPRTLFLMIPAGAPVDAAIASLIPLLTPGDLIIDGGNSFFVDTERRVKQLQAAGLHLIGMGVSGGETGALWGPSLMPGGHQAAWPRVRPMFEAIAAKAADGQPCVDWMGAGGSGHYVKMVHNGIEYADMQLIAEVYDLLHRGAGYSNARLSEIFAHWNTGVLRSYLIEITAHILARVDDLTGRPLVDLILDEAAQKGTGKWTSQTALDTGAPIPTINAAVVSRLISALKPERVTASRVFGAAGKFTGNKAALLAAAEKALYASKITAYAQGLALLNMASTEYQWGLDISRIVPVWRAGCIIRAALLGDITAAYRTAPGLPNLLLDDTFTQAVKSREAAWRQVAQTAVGLGIPMLATGASLAYFDAYRSEVLPANLTQAQRDYFGAHTYRRTDRDGSFHTQWEA